MKHWWSRQTEKPAVRKALVGVGFFLIALTPLVGPLPGPGGVIVFAAGLSLVLRYSEWAKRQYVRFKRKHPRKGAWADWGLRRGSHLRREAKRKEAEAAEAAKPPESPADLEATDAVETAELHMGPLHAQPSTEPGVRD
ncbi:MAG: hypothetical protein ACJ8DZ_07635 [Allosphingosinicella sp.]